MHITTGALPFHCVAFPSTAPILISTTPGTKYRGAAVSKQETSIHNWSDVLMHTFLYYDAHIYYQ